MPPQRRPHQPGRILANHPAKSPSSIRWSFPAVGPVHHPLESGNRQAGQRSGSKPHDIRAKLPTLVLEPEREGMIPGSPVAAKIAVRPKNRHAARKGLENNAPGVGLLFPGDFAVLMAHGIWGQDRI